MANPVLIPYRAHRTWVRSNLLDESGLLRLWLVRVAGRSRAVGFTQLQLDQRHQEASIGVMFREPERYRYPAAIASVITVYIAFERLGLQRMRSYVLPEHQAAIEHNQAFGGRVVESDKPGMVMLTITRDEALSDPAYLKVMARIGKGLELTEK
jgi:hypothetical protein